MKLSARAGAYLGTLRRHEPLPVQALRDALRREELEPSDAWLDFQARYAGYEESLGNEKAIWGIVQRDPYYLAAYEVERGDIRGRVFVACADVHPSFEYRLYENGEFHVCGWVGRSETFDHKVERLALVWEMSDKRSWVDGSDGAPASSNALHELLRQLQAEPVPEASDQFTTAWRARDIIVFENRDGRPDILVPADAREWLAQYARTLRGTS